MKNILLVVLILGISLLAGNASAVKPEPAADPEPFQFTQVYTVGSGITVFQQPLFQVPEGKRFVLEHISVDLLTQTSGWGMRSLIEISDIPGTCPQDPIMRHTLSVSELVILNPTYYSWVISQPLRLYADTGQQLCLYMNRYDQAQSEVGVHLTGYLTNM